MLENLDEQRERFEQGIYGDYDYVQPRRGQVRAVMIVAMSDHEIVVDLGGKRDGLVMQSDLSAVDEHYRANLKVGDSIPVTIVRPWGEDEIIVSLTQGLQQEDWLLAERLMESGDLVDCEVVDANRGGLMVRLGRLDAFVPNSHLGGQIRLVQPDRRDEAKAGLVGQVLPLVVIEVDQARRRLVLSRRVAERQQRRTLLDELAPGQVRMGVVRNIVQFGAFVDLGGVDGLIHISELDWQHIDDPSEVIQVGERVSVQVLGVDPERQRIGLSRKRLLANPWDEVSARIAVGDVVQGRVTSIKPFGEFVDIGQGVRGLIRNKEESGMDAMQDPEILPGSEVRVRVLDIDHVRHQIDLALIDFVIAVGPESDWAAGAYSGADVEAV